IEGEQYYVKCIGEVHSEIFPEDTACQTIKSYLDQGGIYTRKEKPWWEGYECTPVMVRNKEESHWRIDIFKKKYGNSFCCLIGEWKQARPLTTAERDSIKVRD
nr:hypothetical protein [Acidiferrobacterales bacterium]